MKVKEMMEEVDQKSITVRSTLRLFLAFCLLWSSTMQRAVAAMHSNAEKAAPYLFCPAPNDFPAKEDPRSLWEFSF